MADKKPCDELARALVVTEPSDLAVVTAAGSDEGTVRAAVAQALGGVDVTATAGGGATWFVQARGAHRLVGQRVAGRLQVRAAHWVVIGRADGAAIDVAVWRELFRACDGKGHAPLVVACATTKSAQRCRTTHLPAAAQHAHCDVCLPITPPHTRPLCT